MKKTKLIALTMVVALMMVGAGYAAWTDTLNITQEVKTGQLDVHFVNLLGGEVISIDGNGTTARVDYFQDNTDSAGQNTWDNAKITINNAYPSCTYEFQLQMKNESTMPVELTGLVKNMSTNAFGFIDADDFDNMSVSINGGSPINFDADDLITGGYNYSIPINATIEINFTFTTPEVDENTTYKLWVEPTFGIYQ